MPGFKDALRQFQDNGCFKLQEASIGFNELKQLRKYLSNQPALPPYHPLQFQLTEVRLLPFYHSQLTPEENNALTGSTVQEELPPSLQARPPEPLLQPDDPAFRLLSYIGNSGRRRATNIKETSEMLLLSLFTLAHWEMIKLENVVIVEGKQE